jgi:chemotaxis protein methyltransferase CheR
MNALADLGALIAKQSGLRIGAAQMGSVAAAVERLRHGTPEAVLRDVTRAGGERLLERLIGEITVKETSFLRDVRQLAAIDWPQLVERARRRGAPRARVWSAACSTGEEAYTLALLAAESLGVERPPVEILGTDIAKPALDEARRGRYDARALRNLDARLVDRHFSVDGSRHVVAPHLKAIVSFGRHNLAHDVAPPTRGAPFDLILCRNVLIYFEPRVVEHVVARLTQTLTPGGSLLLGAADRLCLKRPALRPIASPIGRRSFRTTPAVAPQATRARSGALAPRPAATPVDGPGCEQPGRAEKRAEAAAEWLAVAVRLADAGRLQDALDAAAAALRHDPMNAAAHFIRGSAQLAGDDAEAAVDTFRRALYIDGAFGAAAFQLGRAYDALERRADARGAYARALRTFDTGNERHATLLGHVHIGDLAAACSARLRPDLE